MILLFFLLKLFFKKFISIDKTLKVISRYFLKKVLSKIIIKSKIKKLKKVEARLSKKYKDLQIHS